MRTWYCPYWKYERKLALSCEVGKLRFAERASWMDYVDRYCDSVDGWQGCTLAQNLVREYERAHQRDICVTMRKPT